MFAINTIDIVINDTPAESMIVIILLNIAFRLLVPVNPINPNNNVTKEIVNTTFSGCQGISFIIK
jgi:hypothetical protein